MAMPGESYEVRRILLPRTKAAGLKKISAAGATGMAIVWRVLFCRGRNGEAKGLHDIGLVIIHGVTVYFTVFYMGGVLVGK